MCEKNLITVAIPFYNDDKYLELAIKSVFAQTNRDWKLLLMDDGSSDGSLDIARKYENDPRISVYSDGENRKLPYRLNLIAKLCDTKYLARMDADDIMHPERFERQLKILEDHPEIDVISSNMCSIDKDNNVLSIWRDPATFKSNMVRATRLSHPSVMARTKWFLDNPYDEKAIRFEDTELWWRTHKKYNLQMTKESMLFYREFGGGYYKKYFRAARSAPAMVKKYKSMKWVISAIMLPLKGTIYYIFNLFGKEYTLIKKRNLEISDTDRAEATRAINIVLSYKE